MENLGDRLKLMVKTFRRECHRVLQSERTTIHGADGMLMVLQLAIAEVNKQVTFKFPLTKTTLNSVRKHILYLCRNRNRWWQKGLNMHNSFKHVKTVLKTQTHMGELQRKVSSIQTPQKAPYVKKVQVNSSVNSR